MNLPYLVLHQFMPGFDALRVPARAALFVGLALSGLAAVGLHLLLTVGKGRGRYLRRTLAGLAIVALVLESTSLPIPVQENADYLRHRTLQQAIAAMPPGVVLVLPLDVELNYLAPLTTTSHFYPLVNGVSGHLPGPNGWIFDRLREEAWDARHADLLRALDVRYVVLDRTKPAPQWLLEANGLAEFFRRHRFDVEEITLPGEEIALFEIDSPQQRERSNSDGPSEFEFNHTLTEKEKSLEIFLWVATASPLTMIPKKGRELEITIRGYDSSGERIWKRKVSRRLPNFMPRGYAVAVPIAIPDKEEENTRRLKIRIRQRELGIKQNYSILIPPEP